VVAIVREIAPAYGLDAAFVCALVLHESGGDPRCITPNPTMQARLVDDWGMSPWDALLESSDLGLCQINPTEVLRNRNAPAAWQHLQACDLLDPHINLTIGCKLLRWWLFEAGRVMSLSPPMSDGSPAYAHFPAWCASLSRADRARLYYRATLAYTWPASLSDLGGTPTMKIIHANKIVRTWQESQLWGL